MLNVHLCGPLYFCVPLHLRGPFYLYVTLSLLCGSFTPVFGLSLPYGVSFPLWGPSPLVGDFGVVCAGWGPGLRRDSLTRPHTLDVLPRDNNATCRISCIFIQKQINATCCYCRRQLYDVWNRNWVQISMRPTAITSITTWWKCTFSSRKSCTKITPSPRVIR